MSSEPRRSRRGSAGTAFRCSIRSSRPAAGSSSSCSCTIGRLSCAGRGSGGFWRARDGGGGPGRPLAGLAGKFVAHNRRLEGGFVVDDRLLTLADIELPILSVVGSVDEIAPAAGVRAIRLAAPRAEVYELCLDAGHFGLVVGRIANARSWPTIAAWTEWRDDDDGDPPQGVTEVPDDPNGEILPQVRNRVGYSVELAGAVGGGIARSVLGTARRTAR